MKNHRFHRIMILINEFNFFSSITSCLNDPKPIKQEICLNLFHAYPQATFLLNPYGGRAFDPNVEFIGDLEEMRGLLKMVGFGKEAYKSENISARSASDNEVILTKSSSFLVSLV